MRGVLSFTPGSLYPQDATQYPWNKRLCGLDASETSLYGLMALVVRELINTQQESPIMVEVLYQISRKMFGCLLSHVALKMNDITSVSTVCCPALYYGRWWLLTTKECDPQIRQSNPQEISYLRDSVTPIQRGYWPLCSQEHIVSQFNLVYSATLRSLLTTTLVVRGTGITLSV